MTDRKLDALVAERVMGWRRATYKEFYFLAPGHKCDERLTMHWVVADKSKWDGHGRGEMAYAEDCDDYYAPEKAWSPTTNGDGMLAVIERMNERGYSFEGREGEGELSRCARFTKWGDRKWDRVEFCCDNDSLPRAVCLAALRAVGAIS